MGTKPPLRASDSHEILLNVLEERIADVRSGREVLTVLPASRDKVVGLETSPHEKFFFQIRGTNRFHTVGGHVDIPPGHIAITQRDTPHHEERLYQDNEYAHFFCLMWEGDFQFNLYVQNRARSSAGSGHIATGHRRTRNRVFAAVLFKELIQVAARGDPALAGVRNAILLAWLTELHHSLRQQDAAEEGHPLIARCQRLVHEQVDDATLCVGKLAESLDVHPDYLSRLFRKETGETLIHYLTRLRIQLAENLLAHTSISVGEVAELTGFGSRAYFTRVFSRTTGRTPTAFRKRPK